MNPSRCPSGVTAMILPIALSWQYFRNSGFLGAGVHAGSPATPTPARGARKSPAVKTEMADRRMRDLMLLLELGIFCLLSSRTGGECISRSLCCGVSELAPIEEFPFHRRLLTGPLPGRNLLMERTHASRNGGDGKAGLIYRGCIVASNHNHYLSSFFELRIRTIDLTGSAHQNDANSSPPKCG